MFADYHVHTAFSDDSIYPMECVVKDAVGLQMDEICMTDHVDYGVKDDWDSGNEILYRNGEPLANVDYPLYMEEINRIRNQYQEKTCYKYNCLNPFFFLHTTCCFLSAAASALFIGGGQLIFLCNGNFFRPCLNNGAVLSNFLHFAGGRKERR